MVWYGYGYGFGTGWGWVSIRVEQRTIEVVGAQVTFEGGHVGINEHALGSERADSAGSLQTLAETAEDRATKDGVETLELPGCGVVVLVALVVLMAVVVVVVVLAVVVVVVLEGMLVVVLTAAAAAAVVGSVLSAPASPIVRTSRNVKLLGPVVDRAEG